MRFVYSPAADALYIELRAKGRKGQAVRNQEVAPGVILDLDQEGRVLGVEILEASRHVPLKDLMAAAARPPEGSKLRPDVAQVAYRTMLEATGQAPKSLPAGERPKGDRSPAAVKQGRAGGLKGGKARAAKLTPTERSEIAKKAAAKRWQPEATERGG